MKMQDHLDPSGPFSALLYKLLPAGIGAAIMVAVDIPATKRELFARVFVAMSCSMLFGGVVFDWLDTFAWLSWLDSSKGYHHAAVNGVIGACGWFVVGAASVVLKKLRGDPLGTIRELRS